AVEIDKAVLARWQRQVTIGCIQEPAGALAFEVIDHVRQRAAFKNIVFDIEAAGAYFARLGVSSEGVLSALLPGRKVGGPEDSRSPSLYLLFRYQLPSENNFFGLGVY